MSLYRKYRPQTFEDVVGQDHIARTLGNALSTQPPSVAHAYLFCGPRGTGKTSSARLLAKCLNCEEGPKPVPCNACDFCTGVRDNHSVMDLVEIDAASNTQVEKVREHIVEKVGMAPAQGRYRIYIIDEVHMFSASSFNALLKTLEEPPAHAIFVLATTDAHKVPATITSRCQRFDFRRLGPADIIARLMHVAHCEGLILEDNAARLIALQADGAMRDALTLLEQVAAFAVDRVTEADVRLVLGTVSHELLCSMVDSIAKDDAASALSEIERATEEGVSFPQLTRDLTNYCRDLLLLTMKFDSSPLLPAEEQAVRAGQAAALGRQRLLYVVEALRATEKEMRQSTDHRLLLELALVRCASGELPAAVLAAVPLPARRPAVATVDTKASTQPPINASSPAATPSVKEANAQSATPATDETSDATVLSPLPPASSASPTRKGRRINDLHEFIELWPAVLNKVKRKFGATAVAYLLDAYPVALDDQYATLEFKKEFHFEKAREDMKKLPFEAVLNECMAAPRKLRLQLMPVPQKVVAEPIAAVVVETDIDDEDVLQFAQDMFHAEVVGRSGEG